MPRDFCFIADAMVGRLAKWLRLLGFDTLYRRDVGDGELVRIAFREGRVILTRDSHFLRRKNMGNLFFLHSDKTSQQLLEVIAAFKIKKFRRARCVLCNGSMDQVENKEDIRAMMPEYVYLTDEVFLKCRGCGNIYWEGSHLKKFRNMVSDLTGWNEDC